MPALARLLFWHGTEHPDNRVLCVLLLVGEGVVEGHTEFSGEREWCPHSAVNPVRASKRASSKIQIMRTFRILVYRTRFGECQNAYSPHPTVLPSTKERL